VPYRDAVNEILFVLNRFRRVLVSVGKAG